ncbi:bifunctional SulP family inorganic anion transporter/carbonic anhydrase [Methyloglobulus sp.]|uniref:bifunctional SulP family inorganic anion transporter/carbonic anhydrase n=1 Tax=Methyloglobulus sp. TaxID=2518622 RepID=UPI003989DAF4
MAEIQAPQQDDNFSLFSNLKDDFPAGIAVFLLSVPLSLGIALASGAPLFSGLITGIVGGLVVAPLSGSALGISGTAAGLSLIILPAIQNLGFNAFLLAAVFAGVMQILMGLLRAGVIAYYFPSSVISGMLSGIGIIIFLKQIPHAVGYDRDYEGDFTFSQLDSHSSFTELFHMLGEAQPGAILIAVVSLLILLLWELPVMQKQRFFHLLQAPLVVVVFGVFLNGTLRSLYPDIALENTHLVMIPVVQDVPAFLQQLHFPDFSQIANPEIYLVALTLAIVASLETLLSLEAVDKLDPYKRVTPSNRELIAQGIGNISCGLLGGLPLTQVIVRSSINVQSGAKTKAAGFINGLLLLLAVFFIPAILNKIPLASLAAILLVVGYKLVKPETFKALYQSGWYHFIPFCGTVLGLVFTNILFGLLIGLTVALFSILLENYKSAYYFKETQIGNKTIIRLSENVSFLNRANIQKTLESLPAHSVVVIDATRSKYIDYDVYEIIQNFKSEAHHKHIKLILENLRGFGSLPPVEYVRSQTYESQQSLTPDKVLALLKEGNERFVYNLKSNRNLLEQVNDTRDGQFPIAIILSCMDSRTSVELIFDLGLGDVFSARIAGNIINDDILGSMEYACKLAGSRLIVVLGHSHCGAVKGAYADAQLDHLTGLLAKIKPAIDYVHSETLTNAKVDKDELIQKVADKNVQLTVGHIREQSSLLAGMEQAGDIAIVGGMYDIETGKVDFFQGVEK